MIVLKMIIGVLFGLCGGLATAAGYFAVINSIGMLNRAASVTKTRDKLMLIEDVVVLGAVSGTFLSLYNGTFRLISVVSGGLGLIYGLFAGMFIGLFVVSLAENIKVMPILVKRTGVAQGIGYIILSMALGKSVGHIIYYLFLY